MKKEEKTVLIEGFIDLIGGICTTSYANALLTAICPPAGIAASVGCGLLSGAIGDMGGEKAKKIYRSFKALGSSTKRLKDEAKKENPDAISEDYKIEEN